MSSMDMDVKVQKKRGPGRPPDSPTTRMEKNKIRKRKRDKEARKVYDSSRKRVQVLIPTFDEWKKLKVESRCDTDDSFARLLLDTYKHVNAGLPGHGLQLPFNRPDGLDSGPSGRFGPSNGNNPNREEEELETMSDEEPAEALRKHMVCRLCLDIYEKPTLLDCGHTFCLRCLQKNSRILQHQGAFDCPVCRETTILPDGLVEKLPSNDSVASIVLAELRKNLSERLTDGQSMTCLTHHDQPKDIICIDCSEFICNSCVHEVHHGHSVDARDIFETSLQQRVADLNEEWKRRKEALYTHHSKEAKELMNSMKEQIRGATKEKNQMLEENERALLEEVQSLRDELLQQIKTFTSRDISEDRCSALELAMATKPKGLDGDTLTAYMMLCEDLSLCMKDPISVECSRFILKMTRSMQFVPAEIGVTDIGIIMTD